MNTKSIGIVGAGLAGLTAAHYLVKNGFDKITIFESSDRIGGKVFSETIDGFTLDRGFQVFLPSYPEAEKVLEYEKLKFKAFEKGALIIKNGKRIPFYDPESGFGKLIASALNGPGSLFDKFKLLSLKNDLTNKSSILIFDESEETTIHHLEQLGFSTKMINDFWIPFYQGIFLENDLHTSKQLFEFTFKMFIQSGAVVPSKGMQAIPDQLVESIGKEKFKLNHTISSIDNNTIITKEGVVYPFNYIIIATDANRPDNSVKKAIKYKSVTNMYFSANKLPFSCKHVILNARPNRVVNNVAFMSEIAPEYAPMGKHLISVSGNGLFDKATEFLPDLISMFGEEVNKWKHLKTYSIPNALPDCKIQDLYNVKNENGHYVCGDYQLQGSINGAMQSGRMAAEALLKDLNK